MTGLRDVVHEDAHFADLFAGTVWGHIVWTKNVGRPLSPRMADAFVIVHKYQLIEGIVNPDGSATNIGGWIDAATPSVWDGPDDEEHYRVSFMLHGAYPWTNGVGIYLTPPSSGSRTSRRGWPTVSGMSRIRPRSSRRPARFGQPGPR
jgi:hypothetical protein